MLLFPNFRRRSSQESPVGFISRPDSRATLFELWQARHLVVQLIVRDLTVRYRQTALGWLWALLSPALHLALYWGVFGLMVRFSPPEYTAPYPLVLISGLVLWMLFSSTVNAVSESLLNNVQLIKKIWFPRSALTLASTGISLMDFILAVLILLIVMPLTGGYWVPARLPLIVLCGLLTALTGWGMGCVLAVARLRFRDIRHLLPLLMQGLFYATPVVWTPGLISERGQALLSLNPLYALVGLFRSVLPGGPVPSWTQLAEAILGSLMMAAVGYGCFVRYEAQVMDRE